MAFKFVAFFALVAVARAGLLPAGHIAPVAYAAAPAAVLKAAPVAVAQPVLTKAVDEYDPHPQYKFGYEVQDSLSGDSKSQVETRDGDVVQGEYSLIDADGYKRTVQYTADPVNGFNAVVHREPLGVAVKAVAAAPVVKAVAPVAYAAPAHVVKTVAAPVAYAAAPVVKAYAAPVVKAAVAAPVAYAAAAPLAYSAPVAYGQPAFVKAYSAPAVVKTYAAAPAYAIAH